MLVFYKKIFWLTIPAKAKNKQTNERKKKEKKHLNQVAKRKEKRWNKYKTV